MVRQYLQTDVCAQCGGDCCKKLGGAAIPADILRNFGGTLEYALQSALESGDWVVDWWEGDPRGLDYDNPNHVSRGYYLRPRSLGDGRRLMNGSWGGQCLLLTVTGCSLPPHLRPWSCRALEPKPNGKCETHGGGKNVAALTWLHYHDLILDTVDKLGASPGGRHA